MQVIVALTQLIGFRKEADGVHNRRFTLMQLEIPYIRDKSFHNNPTYNSAMHLE